MVGSCCECAFEKEQVSSPALTHQRPVLLRVVAGQHKLLEAPQVAGVSRVKQQRWQLLGSGGAGANDLPPVGASPGTEGSNGSDAVGLKSCVFALCSREGGCLGQQRQQRHATHEQRNHSPGSPHL